MALIVCPTVYFEMVCSNRDANQEILNSSKLEMLIVNKAYRLERVKLLLYMNTYFFKVTIKKGCQNSIKSTLT